MSEAEFDSSGVLCQPRFASREGGVSCYCSFAAGPSAHTSQYSQSRCEVKVALHAQLSARTVSCAEGIGTHIRDLTAKCRA